MSRDDAKRALDTIDILKAHNTYTEADAITIINNLMKRSFADGVQHVKDQQENAIEVWLLVDGRNGDVLFHRFFTKEGSEEWLDIRREAYPGMGYYNYEPKLFREVMTLVNIQSLGSLKQSRI